MPKRFNNLDAALKYLRPTGSEPEAIAPDAPAGTQLRKYQDFKAGKVKVDYIRDANSRPLQLDEVAVKPFSIPVADTDTYIVDFSKRAKDNLTTAGVTIELINVAVDLGNALRVSGFIPARATVRIVTGTTYNEPTSKLTGRKYKSKAANSYTFPFGSQATNGSYSQVRSAIIDAVAEGTANRSVSFKPEIFK